MGAGQFGECGTGDEGVSLAVGDVGRSHDGWSSDEQGVPSAMARRISHLRDLGVSERPRVEGFMVNLLQHQHLVQDRSLGLAGAR